VLPPPTGRGSSKMRNLSTNTIVSIGAATSGCSMSQNFEWMEQLHNIANAALKARPGNLGTPQHQWQ
jgi:hypothetical protein